MMGRCRCAQWLVVVAVLLTAWEAIGEPVRVMPLGDSITQGNKDRASYRRALWKLLEEAPFEVDFAGSLNTNFNGPNPYPDFDLDHEGHWGWRAQLFIDNIGKWAKATQPDVVLMHIGTNDALRNESTESTIVELGQIIDNLRVERPKVIILFAQILPGVHNPGFPILESHLEVRRYRLTL